MQSLKKAIISESTIRSLIRESLLKEYDPGFGDYIPGPDGTSLADDLLSPDEVINGVMDWWNSPDSRSTIDFIPYLAEIKLGEEASKALFSSANAAIEGDMESAWSFFQIFMGVGATLVAALMFGLFVKGVFLAAKFGFILFKGAMWALNLRDIGKALKYVFNYMRKNTDKISKKGPGGKPEIDIDALEQIPSTGRLMDNPARAHEHVDQVLDDATAFISRTAMQKILNYSPDAFKAHLSKRSGTFTTKTNGQLLKDNISKVDPRQRRPIPDGKYGPKMKGTGDPADDVYHYVNDVDPNTGQVSFIAVNGNGHVILRGSAQSIIYPSTSTVQDVMVKDYGDPVLDLIVKALP